MQKALPVHNDAFLWDQFREGSHAAYEALFKKYYSSLYQFAWRYTRENSAAKESVQQVFYQLWVSREKRRAVKRVRAYLFKCLRSYLFRESRYLSRLTLLDDTSERMVFSPEDILIEDESHVYRRKLISEKLNQLPERQREVLYLRYYESLSYQEIAQVLGINYQSVVNLSYRAMQRLRDEEQLRKLAAYSASMPTLLSLLICLSKFFSYC